MYRISMLRNTQNATIWMAEYIGFDGLPRYLAHAAVPDPIYALVRKLKG
jgi:hypothetical protein